MATRSITRRSFQLCGQCAPRPKITGREVARIGADAWLQLSQLRNLSDESRREYLMRAVCAGELAIGERRFVEDRGEFWLVLETRPYMRARHALAEDLWFSGARQEAISHLREMLEC